MLALILLVFSIWIFAVLGLALHRASQGFGLVPILFYVVGLVALLDLTEFTPLLVEVAPDIMVAVTGDVFIPVVLALILVVYINNGTRAAQLLLYSIIGLGALSLLTVALLLVLTTLLASGQLHGLLVEEDILSFNMLRRMSVGRIAIIIDILVVAISYQGSRNLWPRTSISYLVGLPLLLALWTDAMAFHLLGELGTDDFSLLLPGDVLVKTVAALGLWPLVGVYLGRFATPAMQAESQSNRPALDVLNQSFFGATDLLRQTQQELRDSQMLYQVLTEHLQEVFWLSDRNTSALIDYISPAFDTATGYSRQAIMAAPRLLLEIIHPEDRARFPKNLFRYFLQMRVDEFRIVRRDGELRWIRSRVIPLRDAKGKLTRFAGLAEDITEQKTAQERAFKLALEKQRVQLLENFIRDTAHDLRTPIAAILLRGHLLQQVKEEDKRDKYLDELIERIEYLSRLIDNLFTLSRIESGIQKDKQVLNFNSVVADTVKTLQPRADEKGIALRLGLYPQALMLWGNPYDLGRAVSNLIENAIRYTSIGSVTVTTRLTTTKVLLEVQDTGIGIDSDQVDQIFERFFRARTAEGQHIQGTGLGLAIVKSVTDAHQGSIEVESKTGVGTTFRLSFPAALQKGEGDKTTSTNKERKWL